MPGWVLELQRGLGRALKQIHKAGGSKLRYQLITDLTDPNNNKSTLDIFAQLTPLVQVREILGGRWTEVLSAAGTLSAEALPVFIVSRESLKIGPTFHDPTFLDSFQKLDISVVPNVVTGPTFFINQITAIGGEEAGWFLTTVAKFRDHARGAAGF